jgi:hypothetical protein
VGLWAQNVGAQGSSLPPVVLDRAGTETFGVPEAMEGWSWATLDGFLDLAELDALAAAAGDHAGGPALAFSVHDSDSVYLVGADASGVRFRVVVNPEAWEDELPPQELDEAAAWSRDHGSLAPSTHELAKVLDRDYVFAEEGLDMLLARMGLLPADAAQKLGEGPVPDPDAVWSWLEGVQSPQERTLERGRWWAALEHGGVTGYLLAADDEGTTLFFGDDALTKGPSEMSYPCVTGYVVRPDQPVASLGQVPVRDILSNELTRQGVHLGPWEAVPESVPRDLASTAAWLLRRRE